MAAPFARPTGGTLPRVFDGQGRHAAVIRTKAGCILSTQDLLPVFLFFFVIVFLVHGYHV